MDKIDTNHNDVIQWKHFPRYWPFVRGIHRSPMNSPHKGQWRGALMFSLSFAWINSWVSNREAGDMRRYRAHYDVTVMIYVVTKYLNYTIIGSDKGLFAYLALIHYLSNVSLLLISPLETIEISQRNLNGNTTISIVWWAKTYGG